MTFTENLIKNMFKLCDILDPELKYPRPFFYYGIKELEKSTDSILIECIGDGRVGRFFPRTKDFNSVVWISDECSDFNLCYYFIAHEIRHWYQVETGILSGIGKAQYNHDIIGKWYGITYKCRKNMYHLLPWEQDANNFAQIEYDKIIQCLTLKNYLNPSL